jgi:hypothetical protein
MTELKEIPISRDYFNAIRDKIKKEIMIKGLKLAK